MCELETLQLLRRPRAEMGTSWASNDYLGLGREYGWGATGSRLISGDRPALRALEGALARWQDLPSALVFTSGYAANVGALSALLGRDDVVISDALNHASLIDGMRLARARVSVFPHNDLGAVEALLKASRGRRTWVVTESYFSMDADSPDLPRLRALCDAYGAFLYLDEAHALGVFGPEGRGLAAAADVIADVVVGTLGKSLGAQGAFVAGAPELSLYLWNRARSFVFSTGLSPQVAAAAHANVERVRVVASMREGLATIAEHARARLTAAGLPPLGHGPLLPIVVGSEARALDAAQAMAERGFHVQPIRPPTVPSGSARLRITLSARETRAEVDAMLDALIEVVAR